MRSARERAPAQVVAGIDRRSLMKQLTGMGAAVALAAARPLGLGLLGPAVARAQGGSSETHIGETFCDVDCGICPETLYDLLVQDCHFCNITNAGVYVANLRHSGRIERCAFRNFLSTPPTREEQDKYGVSAGVSIGGCPNLVMIGCETRAFHAAFGAFFCDHVRFIDLRVLDEDDLREGRPELAPGGGIELNRCNDGYVEGCYIRDSGYGIILTGAPLRAVARFCSLRFDPPNQYIGATNPSWNPAIPETTGDFRCCYWNHADGPNPPNPSPDASTISQGFLVAPWLVVDPIETGQVITSDDTLNRQILARFGNYNLSNFLRRDTLSRYTWGANNPLDPVLR